MLDPNSMTGAQRKYEEKRARKAGKSLDKWLAEKSKRQVEMAKSSVALPTPKKPGLLSRLLDRAHKPL